MNIYSRLLIGTLLVTSGHVVLALQSDRTQPMHIESNQLQHSDSSQETVFTGAVVATKGSIVMRGQVLTVHQDDAGQQRGAMKAASGQRAFFKQDRDVLAQAPAEKIEAEALQIEYDSKTDLIHLTGSAELRRYLGGKLNDKISGAIIIYNNSTGLFNVDGNPHEAPSTNKKSNRVRAMIGASRSAQSSDKATPTASAQSSKSSQPQTLKSSSELKDN